MPKTNGSTESVSPSENKMPNTDPEKQTKMPNTDPEKQTDITKIVSPVTEQMETDQNLEITNSKTEPMDIKSPSEELNKIDTNSKESFPGMSPEKQDSTNSNVVEEIKTVKDTPNVLTEEAERTSKPVTPNGDIQEDSNLETINNNSIDNDKKLSEEMEQNSNIETKSHEATPAGMDSVDEGQDDSLDKIYKEAEDQQEEVKTKLPTEISSKMFDEYDNDENMDENEGEADKNDGLADQNEADTDQNEADESKDVSMQEEVFLSFKANKNSLICHQCYFI